ncbi:hypothetical protein [Kosakonia sacchari]|uniref:Uncharacterized protein n=1 Tax=Kosakonia sacchari TaxID=1158459 RepID=A0ABZ0MY84_9ENTR|nr:hypothetical protein [Kosakonia sacchari]WOZ79982.1 hypothetical protein Q8Y70_23805 [Kosakonia sacchari]
MTDVTDSPDSSEEGSASLTLRNLPPRLVRFSVAQAKKTNKPRGSYIRDVLEETVGNPVINFMLTSPLVESFDEEAAAGVRVDLAADRDSIQTELSVSQCEAYRTLLGLENDTDLRKILMNNAPFLRTCVRRQYLGRQTLLRGTSLACALFCEMAGQGQELIDHAWKEIFHSAEPDAYNRYRDLVDEIRRMKKLEPLMEGIEHEDDSLHIRIFRPDNHTAGAWQVSVILKGSAPNPGLSSIDVPVFDNRLLIADPGYIGRAGQDPDKWLPGFRFVQRRCRLHLYTAGIKENENPTSLNEVARALATKVDEAFFEL